MDTFNHYVGRLPGRSACASLLGVLILFAGARAGEPTDGHRIVTGEVVDLWCYLDHHGHGMKHRDCAVTCARAGNPVGIVDDKGHVYIAMGGEKHQPGRDVLIDHMAETVTAEGRLVSEGGAEALYVDHLVALNGYCPVAYHKMGKAVPGKPEFQASYDGRTYFFVEAKAKEAFEKNPHSFLPALGGRCIVCKAKMRENIPGDPKIFSIYKGKVYLFVGQDQKLAFDADPEKFIRKVGP